MSKEPLGPVVRDGDDDWADAVNWAVIATVAAEELGVTSENVQDMLGSSDPEVLRLLGQPAPAELGGTPEPFDAGLGLPADFAVQVVEQVGNYGEIYDRNVGAGSPLELERGLNALWTDGGLQYAPPYR
jgi:general L-amino acid transport system substrate-binding protein